MSQPMVAGPYSDTAYNTLTPRTKSITTVLTLETKLTKFG